ncbi:ROP GUANINE NUCLEOTIDE EXCHANGE FACTOR 10 [Salix koriyanagi]|uniref:ROP GUANINE NUCLEOTIDE EXCHANGE FACTOR 10 n=1 Tax=Salix koriyanagi TaxID=2511006 RepID=A0A9Q1A690_9ROSI|nr:ROP GUANINE NUCLEOTIDE EXCHANGE FACTOR 10 [Salix koriyanagi]
MFDQLPGRQVQSFTLENDANDGNEVEQSRSYVAPRVVGERLGDCQYIGNPLNRVRGPMKASRKDDMELMKERFAKLLLGEDMSGGGKGVSSALALSNAITNLSASVFGEQKKLEPMNPERKARWRKEIDWLLSVTDHIVEFVPSQQSKDGISMEIMTTRQRSDLLMNIPALRKLDTILIDLLDQFGSQNEFWYVSKDEDDSEQETPPRNDDKWWIPAVKVPQNGIADVTRRWMQFQKDSVNQVLKAAMAINAQVLSEMEIPENYIESLPKNGRASLGDSIYKSITVEYFDPEQFLSTMDMSTEHKVLDLKNRIEASIVIWQRKMLQKDGKSTWGSADVGQAILESYSRIIESLAYAILSKIEDVLYADSVAQSPQSEANQKPEEELDSSTSAETPTSLTLSDFMGWKVDQGEAKTASADSMESSFKGDQDRIKDKTDTNPKRFSYLEKLENLSGMRSPTARQFL